MAMAADANASKWNQRQLRQMAAGGGAGIVAKTVVAPFERVKIVCQTGESVGMIQTTKVTASHCEVLCCSRRRMHSHHSHACRASS